MSNFVIDTNVILVANNQHENISPECVIACTKRLAEIMKSGTVFVDQGNEIICEYGNKTTPWTGSRVGDVFLKWLINNQGNNRHCKAVPITLTDENEYAEFSDKTLQDKFDPPDRKFIAVAQSSKVKPTVLQAADCKWLNWNATLQASGVLVNFICPCDIRRFYATKFPHQNIPDFK